MKRQASDIVPRRIFLDTCTFQALADCGGYIFGEDAFPEVADYRAGMCPQVVMRPDAPDLLDSLKLIFLFDERAHFDWIVSESSVKEVDDGRDRYRSSYLRDVLDHSTICLSDNPPTEDADVMAAFIASPKCGFVSAKDRKLLIEAASSECDVFLTIEKRLPKMADAMLRHIPLLIATPPTLWALLEPHIKGL